MGTILGRLLDNFKTNLPDEVHSQAEDILDILNPEGKSITDPFDLELGKDKPEDTLKIPDDSKQDVPEIAEPLT